MSLPLKAPLNNLTAVMAIVVVTASVSLFLVAPALSSAPSSATVGRWEAYYSHILPRGYEDFRGRWQDQDAGVHIFSFRYPGSLESQAVLDRIQDGLSGYQAHERVPREISLRRIRNPLGSGGFDEFRFVCQPAERRVYAMFANMDDSEMDSHPLYVRQFHRIAGIP